METLKQANYALKTESVKNRTVCNDLDILNTSVTLKILRNRPIPIDWSINTHDGGLAVYGCLLRAPTYWPPEILCVFYVLISVCAK